MLTGFSSKFGRPNGVVGAAMVDNTRTLPDTRSMISFVGRGNEKGCSVPKGGGLDG